MKVRRNTQSHMRYAGRKGFTLLELLVVVAIIAILASLILPALSIARERANSVQCLSNLRQHTVATHAYVADAGHYPLSFDIRAAGNRDWRAKIFPEEDPKAWQENRGVFDCPSAREPKVFPEGRLSFMDYGYNERGLGGKRFDKGLGLGGHGSFPNMRPAVKSADVAAPAKMLAFGDGFTAWKGEVQDGIGVIVRGKLGYSDRDQIFKNSEERLSKRHGGGLNIAFCDGHAENIELSFLVEDTSREALSVWNRDHKPHRGRLKEKP